MATLLFAEKEQTLFFHPPLEPLENKETALVRRDPELPDESQPKNGDYSMECTDKYPDAEQQALFATMLGMDSLDESSTSVVPLPGDDAEPTSTAKMIASIQDEILQDKCDDYEKHYRRCQLFQELSEYFPLHMVQPAKNLTDFAPIWIPEIYYNNLVDPRPSYINAWKLIAKMTTDLGHMISYVADICLV